jgi:hypothetical protein
MAELSTSEREELELLRKQKAAREAAEKPGSRSKYFHQKLFGRRSDMPSPLVNWDQKLSLRTFS